MHTKTNYTGCPQTGRMALRTISGAAALGGLVSLLASAVVAAPAVTITERASAKPVAGTRVPIALDAVRQTPKAPRLSTDVRPTPFILQTAQRRLTQVASRDASAPA